MKMRIAATIVVVLTAVLAGSSLTVLAQGQEGIKVHGDWTIDIRESDGTLVSHHEFKNALVGQVALARIVSGERIAWRYVVMLASDTEASSPCVKDNGALAGCFIAEPDFSDISYYSKNLTRSSATGTMVLTGTATAGNPNGQILTVRTYMYYCKDLPCAYSAADTSAFTEKTLPSPISVTQGQIIQVKVVISFS